MQQMNYGMMGYCPPAQTAKKKELDPAFQFDMSVLIVVTISAVIACGIIAYQRATGIFAFRAQQSKRKQLTNGRVPGWVFRDRESMRTYLRMDLGYDPEEWRIEMLWSLYEARVAAMRRATVGKGLSMEDVRKKIIEEP